MPIVRTKNHSNINVYDPNPMAKEVIVFLHGWPLCNAMYEYQYDMLLPHYRCIGIDLRGFGDSAAPCCDYSYDAHADDVFDVVRNLGLRQFTLVGFSMGGAIALRYMKRHKGYGVKKLAFLAAAAPCFTKRPDFPYGIEKSQMTQLWEQGKENRPQMLDAFADQFYSVDPGEEFRNWTTLLSLEASAVGTLQCIITLRDEDLRDDTKYVHVPTGIFHGKLDQVCLFELGQQLHEMIPQSKFYAFEKSGHSIFHDELKQFNALFLDFIKQ